MSPCRLDGLGNSQYLLFRFNAARPGHYRKMAFAYFYSPDINDGGRFFQFTSRQFKRLQNADHILYAVLGNQYILTILTRSPLITHGTDDRTIRAVNGMRLISKGMDFLENVINLFPTGAGFHNDNHGSTLHTAAQGLVIRFTHGIDIHINRVIDAQFVPTHPTDFR